MKSRRRVLSSTEICGFDSALSVSRIGGRGMQTWNGHLLRTARYKFSRGTFMTAQARSVAPAYGVGLVETYLVRQRVLQSR